MKILFIADYSYPLKAILPLARSARERGHQVQILSWLRVESDKERIQEILISNDEDIHYLETPDSVLPRSLDRFLSRIPMLGVIWDRLLPSLLQKRMRVLAIDKLKEFSPDILVVTNEHLPLLAFFIDVANQTGIPSVCYLTFSGAFSSRKLSEQYMRVVNPRTWIGPHRTTRLDSISLPNKVIPKIIWTIVEGGIHAYRFWHKLDIEFPTPYFGGGNATVLSAIGEGSKDAFIELGVNPNKVSVVGFQLYEDLYYQGLKHRNNSKPELRRKLGIPKDKPLFLWCTNDQHSYYRGIYSYDEMLSSWISIRDVLLNASEDWQLVIKLHPKESIEDYQPLVHGEERVTLVKDCDVVELISASDIFLTRFSSTATQAICLGKFVLTHNYPPIPGGVLFEDIGGTLHSNSLEELKHFTHGLVHDSVIRKEAVYLRDEFVKYQIDIQSISASDRFVNLLDEIAVSKG